MEFNILNLKEVFFNLLKSTWKVLKVTMSIIGFLAVVVGIIYLLFIQPFLSDVYKSAEMIIYIRLFLFIQVITVFALLRMYNAIVGNSRFLINLHVFLKNTFMVNLLKLVKTLDSHKNSLDNLGKKINSVDETLKKSFDANKEKNK